MKNVLSRASWLSCLLGLLALPLSASEDLTPLKNAFAKQAEFETVIVRIKQTKKIPALQEPVVLKGKLWMKVDEAFRWELGKPIEQVAVYNGERVFLIDDKKKTALDVEPGDRRAKPLLLMLGVGEGSSLSSLEKSFKVTGTTTVDDHFVVGLSPKGILRRFMKTMTMQVNTQTAFMERIEWTQKDGTVVITEFFPPEVNAALPNGIFEIDRSLYTWE